MIEIYQLDRNSENIKLRSDIILQEIENLSREEFDEMYFKAGDIDEEVKNKDELLNILYDREKTVTYGLFTIGDIVNFNGSFYIYYDPYNWKLIDVSKENE